MKYHTGVVLTLLLSLTISYSSFANESLRDRAMAQALELIEAENARLLAEKASLETQHYDTNLATGSSALVGAAGTGFTAAPLSVALFQNFGTNGALQNLVLGAWSTALGGIALYLGALSLENWGSLDLDYVHNSGTSTRITLSTLGAGTAAWTAFAAYSLAAGFGGKVEPKMSALISGNVLAAGMLSYSSVQNSMGSSKEAKTVKIGSLDSDSNQEYWIHVAAARTAHFLRESDAEKLVAIENVIRSRNENQSQENLFRDLAQLQDSQGRTLLDPERVALGERLSGQISDAYRESGVVQIASPEQRLENGLALLEAQIPQLNGLEKIEAEKTQKRVQLLLNSI